MGKQQENNKVNKNLMNRILLSFALCAITIMAYSQGINWNEVKDWDQYVEEADMEEITEYAIFDIDGDNIPEAFVHDSEDGYALLTCGSEGVKCVVNSAMTTALSIVKGQPYVIHQGGCGTGCYHYEYVKIENSNSTTRCICLTTAAFDDSDKVTNECEMFKDGKSKEISKTLFDKLAPKIKELISMEDLDWKAVPANPNIVTATLHTQKGDTVIVKDDNGYLYQIMSDGTLGVAPGGAYSGDITIPAKVNYDGTNYVVTTVRRGAMWKKEGAANIGIINSITLPSSVTLVGADAFRGNSSLKSVKYSDETRIEVRSFWGCPALSYEKIEPSNAYTENHFEYDRQTIPESEFYKYYGTFYLPEYERSQSLQKYTWAFFKYNHSGITFIDWMNFDKEDAIDCWCPNPKCIRGCQYNMKNWDNIPSMFKGYIDGASVNVLLADNGYVATHEFPMYSRYTFDEEAKSAPQAFILAMEKKYGRKVKYSYEAAKLLYTSNEQLLITEFKVKGREAKYVLSWMKDGSEICTYSDTAELADGQPEDDSVWNVDDDGDYGIPQVVSIARDEKGNVELFLCHNSPEGMNYSHLVQKGNKFESVSSTDVYRRMECPEE